MSTYLLTGKIVDQSETGIGDLDVLIQMLYSPVATANGVVGTKELWVKTKSAVGLEGNLPDGLNLIPADYLVEWRVGASVNRGYFHMPERPAILQDEIVSAPYEAPVRKDPYETVYDNPAAVAAVEVASSVKIIFLRLDGQIPPSPNVWFVLGSTIETPDGINVIVDKMGKTFLRASA